MSQTVCVSNSGIKLLSVLWTKQKGTKSNMTSNTTNGPLRGKNCISHEKWLHSLFLQVMADSSCLTAWWTLFQRKKSYEQIRSDWQSVFLDHVFVVGCAFYIIFVKAISGRTLLPETSWMHDMQVMQKMIALAYSVLSGFKVTQMETCGLTRVKFRLYIKFMWQST